MGWSDIFDTYFNAVQLPSVYQDRLNRDRDDIQDDRKAHVEKEIKEALPEIVEKFEDEIENLNLDILEEGKELFKRSFDLQEVIDEGLSRNIDLIGTSLEDSVYHLADTQTTQIGGGPFGDDSTITNREIAQVLIQNGPGIWPSAQNAVQHFEDDNVAGFKWELAFPTYHRILKEDRESLILPDFPTIAIVGQASTVDLSLELGGIPKDRFAGQITKYTDYPSGWASLFSVIFAQMESISSSAKKLEKYFLYNEEKQEVDLVTINVAMADIIKNIVRINHGNVAATSVFREEMSASHIASNTIKDVLDTGGAFLFSESKERNENLSPIKLSEGLRTASDSFSSLDADNIGSHLSSMSGKIDKILRSIKVLSDSIFEKDKKLREKYTEILKQLDKKAKETTGGDFGIEDVAGGDIQFLLESDPTPILEQGLFENRFNFKEQCFLLAFIDALSMYKKTRIDASTNNNSVPGSFEHGKLLPYIDRYKQNACLLSDGDPYAFMNRLTMNQDLQHLFDIPNHELSNLQPKIRLFKVTYDEENQDISEEEIRFDSYYNVEDALKEKAYRGHGVGLQGFDFAYEGSNPFAVKKSISANLKIFANNIDELFRDRGGWRYTDLVMKTGSTKRKRNKCFDEKKENIDNAALNFRLRAQIGLSMPNNLASQTGKDKDKLLNAIRESYVTLNLTPTIHDFDFDEMGRVTMNVKYLAYVEQLFDQAAYNVFANASVCGKRIALNRINRELFISEMKTKCSEGRERINKVKDAFQKDIEQELGVLPQSIVSSLIAKKKIRYINVNHDEMGAFSTSGPSAAAEKWYKRILSQVTDPDSTITSDDPDRAQNSLNEATKATEQLTSELASEDDFDKRRGRIAQKIGSATPIDEYSLSFFYLSDLIDVILANIGEELGSLPAELSTIDVRQTISGKEIDIDENELQEAIDEKKKEIERHQKNFKKLRILLGPAEFQTGDLGKQSSRKKVLVSLGDVPISLKYFLEWITDKLLKKQQTNYPLTRFVNDLVNDLLVNFLNNEDCFGFKVKQRTRITQASITSFAEKSDIDSVSKLIQSKNRTKRRLDISSLSPEQNILNLSGPEGARVSIPVDNEYNYFVFFASRTQPQEMMRGIKNEDHKRGIFHYVLGRDRGLIKTISLSKTQTPGLAEVRWESSNANNLEQLRVIYDVEIDCFANVNTFPGTYIYVDPRGFSPSGKEVADSDLNLTDLGIGGYYMIMKSEHSFASGEMNSKIHARFVNAIEASEALRDCKRPTSLGAGDREPALCRQIEAAQTEAEKQEPLPSSDDSNFGLDSPVDKVMDSILGQW